MWIWFFFWIICFSCFGSAAAQEKCRWVSSDTFAKPVIIDPLSVIEESIRIEGRGGEHYSFEYALTDNTLRILPEKSAFPDSVLLCYRTFSVRFDQPVRRRTLLEHYDSTVKFQDTRMAELPAFDFREELFPTTNLYKSGSLTRGISFGNTQNVFINSALNLQLEGYIADNLKIRASITDQNVPFQPEGNTQQIQDFDNVLIELYNDKFSLAAGDVVLQQRESEFLRYYKNVQGLQFTSDYQLNDKWKASSQAFASIAKGKFASIQLPVLEGVLGPYRISGPNNERFVIIMANSEKVFLDGRQLERGFNADYVIDYNQAEITFTPNVLITEYSRVKIDFEYAERNYSRAIIGANHRQSNGKADVYLNYYQEKDNRNSPLFNDFTPPELGLLASVGDQTELAVNPRIDSVAFDPNRILYAKLVDSTQVDPIIYYEHSTDPVEAHFALSFSQVGAGRGDYRRLNQLGNGIVYEYVSRINGLPQGDYSILSQLPAPDSKRMVTAGTKVKLNEHEKVYTELALSSVDKNLFSEVDDADNQGLGVKVGIQSEGRESVLFKGYGLKTQTEYEYNSTNFNFIDRFRYIEFDRDWGLTQEALAKPAAEHFLRAGIGFEKDDSNRFDYLFYLRNRTDVLTGLQHTANWNLDLWSRVFVRQEFFRLNAKQDTLHSDWTRYKAKVRLNTRVVVPGYQFSLDQNALTTPETGEVLGAAMNYKEHLIFLQNSDSLKYAFLIDAAWREDKAPYDGDLLTNSRAFTSNFTYRRQWAQHSLRSTFTYRELEYVQQDLQNELNVMGKLDYQGTLGKNVIRNELSYAIGNGRELQREFVFLPAPNGDGTHTWRDDTKDGVQQLNEFYLAINPEERQYIKIFVPTDTYIQAYTSILNYRVQAKFPEEWGSSAGLKAFLYRFSNTTSLSVEKKVTSDSFVDRVNPFVGGVKREDVLSLRQVIRTSLFFNRASAVVGFDLSYFDSQFKQLLSGGFEDLIQRDWKLNTRFTFGGQTTLRLLAGTGGRISASDFLDNRNYTVQQHQIGPEFVWQPTPFFRTTASYSFTGKTNTANVAFDERALVHQLGMDVRYAKAIKTTLTGNLKLIQIDYNGVPNSPIGYEMLQALTPGTNLTWNVNWLQKIGEGLQLNLVYEGRNSEGLDRIVHIGRMQVSALF